MLLQGARTRYVDIGANLLDPMFQGVYREKSLHSPDLDHVLARARRSGAVRVFVTAGTVQESRDALNLAREHNAVYADRGEAPLLKSTVSKQLRFSCRGTTKDFIVLC